MPTPESSGIYIPRPIDFYFTQEELLSIDQIDPANMDAFLQKKREFIQGPIGKEFQKYKVRLYGSIHGHPIWLVDGKAIRDGFDKGHIEYIWGGHGYRYLHIPLSPAPEIWIDQIYEHNPEFWVTIWHEFIEAHRMRDGYDYESAHSIASQMEIGMRRGDEFVLPVIPYMQEKDETCGPASIKTVLDFMGFGVKFSEQTIAEASLCREGVGTDPDGMVRGVEALGYRVYMREHFTVEEVKTHIRRGYPVIANHQFSPAVGDGHYATIIGYSETHFFLADPYEDIGHIPVKIDDFMGKWYELEDGTTGQGMVIFAPGEEVFQYQLI